ncbi:MAG: hypothetical protein AAFY98_02695 [Verrucomicrobiota bacterium]
MDQKPKDQTRNSDELLDQLLTEMPAPEAPDWFEARLMARLRREKEQSAPLFSFGLFAKPWILGLGATAVLALTLLLNQPQEGAVTVESAEISKEEINEALTAFASYQQEATQWSYELF